MRYVVSWPKSHQGRTFWIPVGTAFNGEDGRIDIILDAIPIGFESSGRLYLFPREQDDASMPAAFDPPPKIHKRKDKRKALCGYQLPESRLTDDWGKVTCKLCLEERPDA